MDSEWSQIAANAIAHAADMAKLCVEGAACEYMRPSAVFRPKIYPDGSAWCALLGDNLMEGVSGFGSTPNEAMYSFDRAWNESIARPAMEEGK